MALETVKNKLFDKHGVTVTLLCGDDTVSFPAFLQPLRYKNKIYLSGVATELGYDGLNKYLLLAPPEVDIAMLKNDSCTVTFDGSSFAVDHCEPVYFGKKCLYHWAVVHKEGR